jgi:hypothetical protein
VGKDEEMIKAYIRNQESDDGGCSGSRFSGSRFSTALSGSQNQAPGSAGGTVTIPLLLGELPIQKKLAQAAKNRGLLTSGENATTLYRSGLEVWMNINEEESP